MMSDKRDQQNPLSRNFLGKNFYVVVTRPTAPLEKLEPLIPAHLANQVRLEKEGTMFAAGPLTNEDGTRYGGMFVLRANSFEEARAIADADPLHKAGLRSYTLMRWTVNEGSYGVRVNYSDQSVTIE
jgi:uncharacterized protein YciI